jgi:hypothetical protein
MESEDRGPDFIAELEDTAPDGVATRGGRVTPRRESISKENSRACPGGTRSRQLYATASQAGRESWGVCRLAAAPAGILYKFTAV